MDFRRSTAARFLFPILLVGTSCAKMVGLAPDDVARRFFESANDGQNISAAKLTTPNMLGIAKRLHADAPDPWREYLNAISKNGTIDHIDSKFEFGSEDSATVKVTLTFKDGTKSKRQVRLNRAGLFWKIRTVYAEA